MPEAQFSIKTNDIKTLSDYVRGTNRRPISKEIRAKEIKAIVSGKENKPLVYSDLTDQTIVKGEAKNVKMARKVAEEIGTLDILNEKLDEFKTEEEKSQYIAENHDQLFGGLKTHTSGIGAFKTLSKEENPELRKDLASARLKILMDMAEFTGTVDELKEQLVLDTHPDDYEPTDEDIENAFVLNENLIDLLTNGDSYEMLKSTCDHGTIKATPEEFDAHVQGSKLTTYAKLQYSKTQIAIQGEDVEKLDDDEPIFEDEEPVNDGKKEYMISLGADTIESAEKAITIEVPAMYAVDIDKVYQQEAFDSFVQKVYTAKEKTIQAQAMYVLGELAEITGKKFVWAEYLHKYDMNELVQKQFNNLLEEFSTPTKESGVTKEEVDVALKSILIESSNIANLKKIDPSIEKYEDIFVPEVMKDEVNQIVEFSLSSPEKMKEWKEKTALSTRMAHFNEEIAPSSPFTKEDLERTFEKGGKFDLKKVNEQYQKLLGEKFSQLDESERTEQKFAEYAKKLNQSLEFYVYPKNNVVMTRANKPTTSLSDLAYKNISPETTARNARTMFDAILQRRDLTAKDRVSGAFSIISHLEAVHQKRSFFTKVVDFFRRTGEDSTIKAMKAEMLRQNNGRPYNQADLEISPKVESLDVEVLESFEPVKADISLVGATREDIALGYNFAEKIDDSMAVPQFENNLENDKDALSLEDEKIMEK